MNSAKHDPSAINFRAQWAGPVITLALVAAIEMLSRTAFRIPNPPAFLVLSIVFSAFQGGLGPGLVSALMAWLYLPYFFSDPGRLFQYTEDNLRRVIVWAFALPTIALMVGVLKRRAERAVAAAQTNRLLQVQMAERERAEATLNRVNRALRTLSQFNQALVRLTEEPELLREACRISVEVGGYRFAWIGLAEQDEHRTVRPAAQAGYEAGYLETLHLTWADAERGRGPTGTAIRTGQPSVVQHILTEAQYAPWRADAVRRGYAASIALPLLGGEGAFGALNIYAAEPEAFDAEEVKLLMELANDLAYGIAALRTRAERRRAEQALREREQQLSSIYDTVADVIFQLTVEADGRYRFASVNQAFLSVTGLVYDQVVGKRVDEVIPEPSLTLVLERYGEAIREKRIVRWEETSEYPTGRLTGEVSVAPVFDDGNCTYLVGAVHDITERKRAEEALREGEQRYRSLFENMLDGFAYCKMLFDDQDRPVDFVYLAVNEAFARLTGLENVVGKQVTEVIPGIKESSPELFEIYGRVALTGQPERFEIDFKPLALWLSISVYSTEKGYFVAVFDDITQRKQAEAGLAAKNEELRAMTQQLWQTAKLATMGELAASIAHELNNPLGTVSLRVEGLLGQVPANDPSRRALEVIEQEVERMGSLVANLLQFSRRGAQQISTLDVREEIVKTLELIHYQLRQRQIVVAQEFAPDVPLLRADRQQLRQLFLNLFTNASDAMPQGGTLTIRVGREAWESGGMGEAPARPHPQTPTHVFIEVADTGVGIAPEDLPKVGEPFYTTKPEGKGTGLGLAICRRIVQEHGGTLDITSEGVPGRGATVRLILPGKNGSNGAFLKAP